MQAVGGAPAVVAPGVLTAVSAFVLSGEAELSAAFLAWDLLQVLLAAVATRVLVGRLVGAGGSAGSGPAPGDRRRAARVGAPATRRSKRSV